MKLTQKHIGQLVDNGSDGSWVYQLVDIKKGRLLFYAFDGTYVIDTNKFQDWRLFKPLKQFPKTWIQQGWEIPRYRERS